MPTTVCVPEVSDQKLYVKSVLPQPLTADEGVNTTVGQVADPFLLEYNGQTYLWYDGSADGTQQSGALRIKLAIAPMPIERLITTLEGE